MKFRVFGSCAVQRTASLRPRGPQPRGPEDRAVARHRFQSRHIWEKNNDFLRTLTVATRWRMSSCRVFAAWYHLKSKQRLVSLHTYIPVSLSMVTSIFISHYKMCIHASNYVQWVSLCIFTYLYVSFCFWRIFTYLYVSFKTVPEDTYVSLRIFMYLSKPFRKIRTYLYVSLCIFSTGFERYIKIPQDTLRYIKIH